MGEDEANNISQGIMDYKSSKTMLRLSCKSRKISRPNGWVSVLNDLKKKFLQDCYLGLSIFTFKGTSFQNQNMTGHSNGST